MTIANFVNGWYRGLCWLLVLLSPAVYLFQVLAFTLVKTLDWYGTSWTNVFTMTPIAEIWSYARYGR